MIYKQSVFVWQHASEIWTLMQEYFGECYNTIKLVCGLAKRGWIWFGHRAGEAKHKPLTKDALHISFRSFNPHLFYLRLPLPPFYLLRHSQHLQIHFPTKAIILWLIQQIRKRMNYSDRKWWNTNTKSSLGVVQYFQRISKS